MDAVTSPASTLWLKLRPGCSNTEKNVMSKYIDLLNQLWQAYKVKIIEFVTEVFNYAKTELSNAMALIAAFAIKTASTIFS